MSTSAEILERMKIRERMERPRCLTGEDRTQTVAMMAAIIAGPGYLANHNGPCPPMHVVIQARTLLETVEALLVPSALPPEDVQPPDPQR